MGFDLSPGMIAQAEERARAAGLDNVEFRTGDVSGRFPFGAAGFAGVSYCTIRWRSYAFVRGERARG